MVRIEQNLQSLCEWMGLTATEVEMRAARTKSGSMARTWDAGVVETVDIA